MLIFVFFLDAERGQVAIFCGKPPLALATLAFPPAFPSWSFLKLSDLHSLDYNHNVIECNRSLSATMKWKGGVKHYKADSYKPKGFHQFNIELQRGPGKLPELLHSHSRYTAKHG